MQARSRKDLQQVLWEILRLRSGTWSLASIPRYVCMYVCTQLCLWHPSHGMYVCMYVCTQKTAKPRYVILQTYVFQEMCMYVCGYVCTVCGFADLCVFQVICMHVGMYVWLSIRIYACRYIYLWYTHIHTYILAFRQCCAFC